MNGNFHPETMLRDLAPLKLRTDVHYFQLTTLGVGKTAPLVADVDDDAELVRLLEYADTRHIPVFVIGGGSNLVGSDEPFPGVILRLKGEFTRTALDREGRLIAGGGAKLPDVVRLAAENGFGGLTALAGIPGTIGGAVRMNAGAHGANISDKLVRLRGFDLAGRPWESEADRIEWRYRDSSVPERVIVTAVEFQLPASDKELELAALQTELIARRLKEPAGRTAGCVFRNPGSCDSAGKLIDLAGLKGMNFGPVVISPEHGNYLLNRGGASEADFLTALSFIRGAIADRFGLYLEPEVKFIFPEHAKVLAEHTPAPEIAVFMGGDSSEREVSLRSGAAVANALRNGGYRVRVFDLKECAVPEAAAHCDLIFPVLHGGWGEGGGIQRAMEAERLDFIGCDSVVSDLVMDKLKTKERLHKLGIPTAPDWTVTAGNLDAPPDGMTFPVVVKVPCEGSTVGVEKIGSAIEWRDKLPGLLARSEMLLAEKFIAGRECTVPVVLDEALAVVEIRPPAGWYDYDAKYVYAHGHTQYFCPPVTIGDEEQKRLQALALRFYREFGCRDLVRVDFIVGNDDGVPYVLEGNSLPGFTATSLVPKAAACMGISFERLCARLVRAHLGHQKPSSGSGR